MAANPEKRRYSFKQYRRLFIPIEKRTLMPLEVIEPANEQEDS